MVNDTQLKKNRTIIQEIITTRMNSLINAHLVSKSKNTYYLQQISDISKKSSKISIYPTIGLLYQLIQQEGSNKKKQSKPKNTLLYTPDKSITDVISEIAVLSELLKVKNLSFLEELFIFHLKNVEQNINFLKSIEIKDNRILKIGKYRANLEEFITQLESRKQDKNEKIAIDPKIEEKIQDQFEKYFKNYTKIPQIIPAQLSWNETLIDKARTKYFESEDDSSSSTAATQNKKADNQEEKKTETPETSIKLMESLETSRNELFHNQQKKPAILTTTIDTQYSKKNQLESIQPILQPGELDPWATIGSILVIKENDSYTGIGIIDIPVTREDNRIFIPVIIEKDVELDQTDILFREMESLRISNYSDSTQTRRDIVKNEITEYLGVPENISLFPTFLNEYIARRNIHVELIIKPQLLRKEYYPLDQIQAIPGHEEWFEVLNKSMVRMHLPRSKPYPSRPINSQYLAKKKKIATWDDKIIGQSAIQIELNGLGAVIIIEYDFPSTDFLSILLPKLRGYDPNQQELWYLRFFVAKKIEVFEAEALLYWNLWKLIWNEKIPILPYDVRTAFLGLVPASAILPSTDILKLKRGVTPNNTLIGNGAINPTTKILNQNGQEIGQIVGISYDDRINEFSLVYTPLTPGQLFEKLGKQSQNIEKLSLRIKAALGISKDEDILTPRSIITYLTFYSAQFATYEDLSDFSTVITWLDQTFQVGKLAFTLIQEWDYTNNIIKTKVAA